MNECTNLITFTYIDIVAFKLKIKDYIQSTLLNQKEDTNLNSQEENTYKTKWKTT